MPPASAHRLTAEPTEPLPPDEGAPPLHEVPLSTQGTIWMGAAIALAALLFAYAVPLVMPGDSRALWLAWAGSILAGLLTLYMVKTARWLRVRFVAGPEGLHVLPPAGDPEIVRWASVVRMRERPFLQRMELATSEGRVIGLEYQLTEFGALAEAVCRYAPPAALPATVRGHVAAPGRLPSTFHRAGTRELLLVMVPVAIGGSVMLFDGVLLVAYGIAIASAWAYASGWKAIRLEPDALAIERPFRTRRIPMAQVLDTKFEMEDMGKGHRRAAVYVLLAGGEVLRFMGAREGELALHAALDRWHRR